MKQDKDTLKSYFETGDYPTEAQFADLIDSFADIDETIVPGMVFINDQYGDDATGAIEDSSKPFKTIDKAIEAYQMTHPREEESIEHPYCVLNFTGNGVYEWNALIPERNLLIKSDFYEVTIDFSNSEHEVMNENSGLPFHLMFKGEFLVLKNHSENLISHSEMKLHGSLKEIDSERSGFAGFNKSFISCAVINIKYDLLHGHGNLFRTLDSYGENTFVGNIKATGDFVLNNQGTGMNTIDFDKAESTGKIMFVKASLPGSVNRVLWGSCVPASLGNFFEVTSGTTYIYCKPGAKSYGYFMGGTHLYGYQLEALSTLARIGGEITFTKMHLKLTGGLASLNGAKSSVVLKDTMIEMASGGLLFIEANTNFSGPILQLMGNNTILHAEPDSDLVVKYPTSNPENVSYTQHMAFGLTTNAVLNTEIEGNTVTTAVLNSITVNRY